MALLLKFAKTPSAVEDSCSGVLDYLAPLGLDRRTLHRTEVIIEELVGNIVRHAKDASTISIGAQTDGRIVELSFDDDGAAFDPFSMPDPEPLTSVQHATLGGRGIMLVRKLSASTSYERIGGHNRVRVRVRVGKRGTPT